MNLHTEAFSAFSSLPSSLFSLVSLSLSFSHVSLSSHTSLFLCLHQFFRFFVGLTVNLSMHKDASFTESASLSFVILTYGKMSTEVVLHGLRDLFPEGLRPLRVFPFKELSRRIESAVLEEEKTNFPLFHYFLIVALSFCFTRIAFSFFPFNAEMLPFASSFRWYSCFNFVFWPQNFGL